MIKRLTALALSFCCTLVALPDWNDYKKQTIQNLGSIPGWCSPEKAEKMMDLIYEAHPHLCVEIGVFGGCSIYPTARALDYVGSGGVYCIDPWIKQPALEGYPADNPHYQWWEQINYDELFRGFSRMLVEKQLSKRCAILRMTSTEAASWFAEETIDILHIDGNHSLLASSRDVQMFLPKVKRGGYIWLDDADWISTTQAQRHLFAACTLIEEKCEGNHCLLFRKN